MFELRHLSASRARPTARELVGRGLRQEMLMRPGLRESLAAAVADDPSFGYAHAGLALLDLLLGGPVEPHLAAARSHAGTASEPEQATIALVSRCVRVPAAQRLVEARAHLARYPSDLLAIILGLASVDRGETGPRPAIDLLDLVLPAHQAHWWVPGVLATWLAEAGQVRPAWRLAERALAAEPGAWHAAHAFAHVAYATDEHRQGADWLDRWIGEHRPEGYALAHVTWHVAVGRLATGDGTAASRALLGVLTPASPEFGVDAVELATASWLCLGAGDATLAHRVRAAVRRDPARLVAVGSPLSATAAGLLLAAAGQVAELDELTRLTGQRREPVYRQVVLPMLAVCAELAVGDRDAVSHAVDLVEPDALARLGGSGAERDAFEHCLLLALRGAVTRGLSPADGGTG
ncbi:MAG TPA: hypothetical protein VF054_19445 [Micromonosporaceae bacterium]